MSEVSAPLLGLLARTEGESQDDRPVLVTQSPLKRYSTAAGGLLCISGVALLYYVRPADSRAEFEPAGSWIQPPHEAMVIGRNASLEVSNPLDQEWGSSACYKYTGVTCATQNCDAFLGATCKLGHCTCESGCVSALGVCTPVANNHYELVHSNFRLRNSKWPDQILYAPRTAIFSQLRTSTCSDKTPSTMEDLKERLFGKDTPCADRWNMYRMPGAMWSPNIPGMHPTPAYILTPVEFPEYAVGIESKWKAEIGGDALTNDYIITGSSYKVSLFHLDKRLLLANAAPFNPRQFMNQLCRPKKAPSALNIRGDYGQVSWYVHHWSYRVFGWGQTDPEDGGYWLPEPPLPFDVEEC